MNRRINGQTGISLIEALIALVVLSLGLIAIAKLQSDFVTNAGLTKARSEAVSIADAKLEELRNLATRGQFDLIVAGNSDVTGSNAEYAVAWTIVDSTNRKEIEVTVRWDGPRGAVVPVVVASSVVWDDPLFRSILASGAFAEPVDGRISPIESPTLSEDWDDYFPGISDISELPNVTLRDDGLFEIQDGDRRLLVEAVNGSDIKVLAATRNSGFSVIQGSVYIDNLAFTRNQRPTLAELEVTFTGAKRPCEKLRFDTTGNFPYFEYRCVVTSVWTGRLGAYFVSGARTNDRFCVGDSNITDSTHDATRKPALDNNRLYRGFAQMDAAAGQRLTISTIGVNDFVKHDFVVTRLTGSPTDSDCKEVLDSAGVNDVATNRHLGGLGQPPYHDKFPGRFFCLTDECPSSLPTGGSFTTTISGDITRIAPAVISDLEIDGGECGLVAKDTSYEFACTIDWRGWAAEMWSGELKLVGGNGSENQLGICSPLVAYWTDELGQDISFDEGEVAVGSQDSVNDSVNFFELDPALTEMTLNFTVRHHDSDGECP